MRRLTSYQKIKWVSIIIIILLVGVYVFRRINTPVVNVRDSAIKILFDSAVQEHARQEAINAKKDSIRQGEVDSLRASNEAIRNQIKNSIQYRDQIIRELYDANAPELEKFFSDRYDR